MAPSLALEGQEAKPSGGEVRRLPLSKTLRFPTRVLTSATLHDARSHDPALLIWPGAVDEPPEGPNGFDVLADGSILITDPLSARVVNFDAQGSFLNSWEVGFAADSIHADRSDLVMIREATTGQEHAFGREGHPSENKSESVPLHTTEARLVSRQAGKVNWSGGKDKEGSFVAEVNLRAATLLSLECIGVDDGLNAYVALESADPAAAGGMIALRKDVRKYSPAGKLLWEIDDLPLGYFVTPVDELRVRGGSVYQLLTTRSAVQINVWHAP